MEKPLSTIPSALSKGDCDENTDLNVIQQRYSSDTFFQKNANVIQNEASGDEEEATLKLVRKRVHRFTDSDSEPDKENAERQNKVSSDVDSPSKSIKCTEGENENNAITENSKSRIRRVSGSDDSDSSCKSGQKSPEKVAFKNEGQQKRMESKRSRLKHKFKNLLNSRLNDLDSETKIDSQVNESVEDSHGEGSDYSDFTSIDNIKHKIKEINKRRLSLKMSICDPDTSDEETPQKKIIKPKQKRKSTQLTSPKPVRMSAKQAMESMQKIKSESNRMLREKEVSLPYHRPKALSLKDIMSRRRPALTPDGKILPIKMNEEQLKQYALSLEQRQKEMMELCKSDTDEENEEPLIIEKTETRGIDSSNNIYDKISEISPEKENVIQNIANTTSAEQTKLESVVSENIDTHHLDDSIEENLSNTDMKLVYNNSVKEAVDIESEKIGNDLESMAENNANKPSDSKPQFVHAESKNDLQNVAEIIKDTNKQSGNSKRSDMECDLESVCEIRENNEVTDANKQIMHSEIENTTNDSKEHKNNKETVYEIQNGSNCVGGESQLISHFDSANRDDSNNLDLVLKENGQESTIVSMDNEFPDDDININMEDIDALIENAEILKNPSVDAQNVNSPILIRDPHSINMKPKLTGAPGMIIDLDGNNPLASRKLSGVELLKERFIYFAKLKTPDELEREKEKRLKPGTLHLKLKQELEEKIAEQRSLEWAKRLEEEKQQQMELNAIGSDTSDVEDDIEKIEAKLDETEDIEEDSSSEEDVEDDVPEKPRKRNPLLADEAEESDCNDEIKDQHLKTKISDKNGVAYNNEIEANVDSDRDNKDDDAENEADENVANEENIENDADDSSEESSESEEEERTKPKKGRILKAFEDSDDENATNVDNKALVNEEPYVNNEKQMFDSNSDAKTNATDSQSIKESQDDELQLAQLQKSFSEDLFTSQESVPITNSDKLFKINVQNSVSYETDLGTQTFSILNAADRVKGNNEVDLICHEKMSVICETQPYDDANFDAIVGMCSGSFSQNLVTTQDREENNSTQSQEIGEDVLALCTGKFYDNQFVSQIDDNLEKSNDVCQRIISENKIQGKIQDEISDGMPSQCSTDIPKSTYNEKESHAMSSEIEGKREFEESNVLKDILEELNESKKVLPKPKFFGDTNKQDVSNRFKKKFIFDSDDDITDEQEVLKEERKKKFKKKKLEKRALQISDNEEDECLEQEEEEEEFTSDIEDDSERIVEYDSEENEVEVKILTSKKKRKVTEFFEKEAELTSEDEWVGSGDEDEAGLDRMEREAGDDDTFHEAALQAELGQIHIRDVLDQDKRDVRLLQELLFEDGDLGDGHRQRKFRWANADGEEQTGTVPDEFADTQEEEFESEEQWRKQRHEREVFLRSMKQDETRDNINISINRSTIIKANLCSKTMSSLLLETNTSSVETDSPVVEKKKVKDLPSPKKPFHIFQQNYYGSLLTRGSGALARLAALATPLVVDDDTSKVSLAPTNRRKFVFAAVNRDEDKPKVTKRKAESNAGTPQLLKKMKTEEKEKLPRNSLLDHLKA